MSEITRDFDADKAGGTSAYRHEDSTDAENMARCSGLACVEAPLRYGPSPYTVRCDDETHPHREVACISPDGRRRLYDVRAPHAHTDGTIWRGMSKLWPRSEFERIRVPQLQRQYGLPLPPRAPAVKDAPQTGSVDWDAIAALARKAMSRDGLRQIAVSALGGPLAAVRPPLRELIRPEADRPSQANVAPDDGWGDGSDIPF